MANEQYLDSDGLNQFWKSAKKEIMHEVDSALGKVCTISISANDDELGVVSGGGSASIGTEIVLSANPKTDADFVGWKENGEIVSVDNRYKFTVEKDRVLVGEFVYRLAGLGVNWKLTGNIPSYDWKNILASDDKFILFPNSSSYSPIYITLADVDRGYSFVTGASGYSNQSVYGNGIYLSFHYNADNEYYVRSTDGITWTTVVKPSEWTGKAYPEAIIHDGKKFIAAFNVSSTCTLLESTDGITWTNKQTISVLNGTSILSIGYWKDKYIVFRCPATATVSSSTICSVYSFDLKNWKTGTHDFTTGINGNSRIEYNRMVSNNDMIMMMGATSSTNTHRMKYSYDGIHWKDYRPGITASCSIDFFGGKWIAGANVSSTIPIYYSLNGFDWFSSNSLSSAVTPTSVAHIGEQLVVGLNKIGTGNANKLLVPNIS